MPLAVCATPIGNLADVTLRVLEELGAADLVLCEDTRHTRILLERHGITARLSSYHRHNEAARAAGVLERLRAGERVALVSDAGLPGINDPGARLIAAASAEGIEVTVLPGASAVETALVVSGVGADRYQFVGYLPRRAGELRALAGELRSWPGAVVAFESPRRLPASLGVLAAELPGRSAAVCRELTKRFEEVVRGSLEELAERFAEPPRGEITLVLGPPGVTFRAGSGRGRGTRRSCRARRGWRGEAHRRRGRLRADRGGAERALPRLSVTRQSKCVAPGVRSRYGRRMFARRTTRWVMCLGSALVLALVAGPSAMAWAWPVDGAVLRGFSVSGDTYAAGQHRGIDIALGASSAIRAPVSGEVTFAGLLPTNGLTVTIATGDYKTSLTHLGTLRVRRGASVAEGDVVAEPGPSGEAEYDLPYVHLGIRVGASESYVDPLELLPPRGTASPPPAPEAPPAPLPQPAPSPPVAASPPAPAPPTAPAAPPAEPVTAQPPAATTARSGCRTARVVWRASDWLFGAGGEGDPTRQAERSAPKLAIHLRTRHCGPHPRNPRDARPQRRVQ